MKTLLAMAAIVVALASSDPPAVVAAENVAQAKAHAGVSDFSAQRRHRRHVGYRTYTPIYYYARPVYYRPYPYTVPAPFVFGIAYGPRW